MSQDIITGRIVDFHTKQPLNNIRIVNQKDSLICLSDSLGFFEYRLNQSDTLLNIFGIGYGYSKILNISCLKKETNLGLIPVFEYYMTGGTIEVADKKNFFGKTKKKQPIICHDWVIHDSIGKDSIFQWNSGKYVFELEKIGANLVIDLCEIK